MFFIAPLINIVIQMIPKNRVAILTLMSGVGVSVVGTFDSAYDPVGLASGYSFVWLAYLYFLGACLKKTNIANDLPHMTSVMTYVCCLGITFLFKLIFHGSGISFHEIQLEDLFINYCSPTVLLMAVLLLIGCLKIKYPSNCRAANQLRRLGSATYCMYIINANPVYYNWRQNRFSFISAYNPIGLIASAILIIMFEAAIAMTLGLLVDYALDKLRIKHRLVLIENVIRKNIKCYLNL